jgi:3-methyladenine DNA glycosylase AlkD
VALIPSVRKGEHVTAALHVAGLLLVDPDDLVQKGYGWKLKEMSCNRLELVAQGRYASHGPVLHHRKAGA